jgi:chromosomal replication initiator protein
MLAMFLARKHTESAYSEIGQQFGGRNHSTVMSAERKVQQWLDENSTIQVASQKWSIGEILSTLEQQLLAG